MFFILFGTFDVNKFNTKIYRCNFETGYLISIPLNGPSPRTFSAVVASHESIYIYGGQNESEEWLNDFWRFDGKTWKLLENKVSLFQGIPNIIEPSISLYNNTIVLCGTVSNPKLTEFVVYVCQVPKVDWTKIDLGPNPIIPPLYGHQLVMVDDHFGFIIGGKLGDQSYNGYIFTLDVSTKAVHIPILSGLCPCHRFHHVAIKVGNSIFVYGGQDEFFPIILDLNDKKWIIPQLGDANSPLKKNIQSPACVLHNNFIYLYGGDNNLFYQIQIDNFPQDSSFQYSSFVVDEFLEKQLKNVSQPVEGDQQKSLNLLFSDA